MSLLSFPTPDRPRAAMEAAKRRQRLVRRPSPPGIEPRTLKLQGVLQPIAWGKPDTAAGRGVCESIERVAPWAAKARVRLSDAVGVLGWAFVVLGALAALAALGGRS